jgi:hypothetical protein
VYVKHVVKLLASSCGMLAPVGSLADAKMSGCTEHLIHSWCTMATCNAAEAAWFPLSGEITKRRDMRGDSRFVQSLMISIVS